MDERKLSLIVKSIRKIKSTQAIYLFGSEARGEAGPLSDIDICVIAPHASEQEKNDIESCASPGVDVVLFEDIPLVIQVRIFREGKLLYAAHQRYVDDLAWRTLKEYFDYKPILKKFIELYLPGAHYV